MKTFLGIIWKKIVIRQIERQKEKDSRFFLQMVRGIYDKRYFVTKDSWDLHRLE